MYKYQISYNKGKQHSFDFLVKSDLEAREKFAIWNLKNAKWFINIKLNTYIVFSNHIVVRELN